MDSSGQVELTMMESEQKIKERKGEKKLKLKRKIPENNKHEKKKELDLTTKVQNQANLNAILKETLAIKQILTLKV